MGCLPQFIEHSCISTMHIFFIILTILFAAPLVPPDLVSLIPRGRGECHPFKHSGAGTKAFIGHIDDDPHSNSSAASIDPLTVPAKVPRSPALVHQSPAAVASTPTPAFAAPARDQQSTTPLAAPPLRASPNAEFCPVAFVDTPLERSRFSPALSLASPPNAFVVLSRDRQSTTPLAVPLPRASPNAEFCPVAFVDTPLERPRFSPALSLASPPKVLPLPRPTIPIPAVCTANTNTSLIPASQDLRSVLILSSATLVLDDDQKSKAAYAQGGFALMGAAFSGLFALALLSISKRRSSSPTRPQVDSPEDEDAIEIISEAVLSPSSTGHQIIIDDIWPLVSTSPTSPVAAYQRNPNVTIPPLSSTLSLYSRTVSWNPSQTSPRSIPPSSINARHFNYRVERRIWTLLPPPTMINGTRIMDISPHFIPLALPCPKRMTATSSSISLQESAQEPLPSPRVRVAAVESVPDASDESPACDEAATTPTAAPAQASLPVESATLPEPALELCHSGQEHEATATTTTTTSDSNVSPEPRPAQSIPPARKQQAGSTTETDVQDDEEKSRRGPRRRPRRAYVRAARAARLLQEEEERKERERKEQEEKEEDGRREGEVREEEEAEEERKEEESGTPTSPVLAQAYSSVSIEKEVEENHGLTASRWAPKEGVKVVEEKVEAEEQLEKKETGLGASRWASEPEAEAEESGKEPGLDASSLAPPPEEEDGEGPGVDAPRWAPKSEGGEETEEEGKGKEQEKSKWHLRRLRRRENRKRSRVPQSKEAAPAPEWPPVCRASLLETVGPSEARKEKKVPAVVQGRPRMSYLPGEPGEPLVAPAWSPKWRTRKWQRQPI